MIDVFKIHETIMRPLGVPLHAPRLPAAMEVALRLCRAPDPGLAAVPVFPSRRPVEVHVHVHLDAEATRAVLAATPARVGD